MLTERLPRAHLAYPPTPLEELPRLRAALGGPRLLIKRDDQTGLATGGNKARKLEFSIADALDQGADTVITLGAVQSNHCRQTAAAAARTGLRCIVVLRGHAPEDWNGNLLLDHLLGARVVFAGDRTLEEVASGLMQELQSAGRRPYLIPVGASNAVGAAGFVAAMEEAAGQLQEQRLLVDRVVFASSSGGTQAGLCVGAKATGFRGQIAAIAAECPRRELQATVATIARATISRLGLEMPFTPDEVVAYDSYLGAGYAVMGEPEQEAIGLTARCEGILLDPVYTGRAMAGLIDLIRRGEFGSRETILFWHTGGSAALFAYAGQLMEVTGSRESR